MGDKFTISKKKKSTYNGIIFLFIFVCCLICFFSLLYYNNLSKTIRDESRGYLQEVSARVASNLDQIIEDNFAMLNMMGSALVTSQSENLEDLQTILHEQQKYGKFDNILLVDENGSAYDINNNTSQFFTFDTETLNRLIEDKQAIDTTQLINNKEYFVFVVSTDNLTVNGEKIIALAGCYNPDTFEHVLSMTSFADQAYSQIITKSGTLVTTPNLPYAVKSGYNVFSTLKDSEIDGKISLPEVQENIMNDVSDQISFSMNGEHRYMVYTPIHPDDWYLLTFVPFKAVNEKSDILLASTLRICALIVIVFSGLVSVLIYVFRVNRRKLEQIAYVDLITGGNTIQKFYDEAKFILDTYPADHYALVYTNIENFKVLNSQLGRKNCDIILKQFYSYTNSVLQSKECLGRLFADNFCILMKYTNEEQLLIRFEDWLAGAENYIKRLNVNWTMPATEFGVYVIENSDMEFPEMVDRAKLALKEFPHSISNKLHYAFYDDAARSRIFREKQLSDMMETALANGEFQVYLQPKYILPEEKIGGAEALVRWNSPIEGMIYPNEFIPLFERNGFIISLDLWVFEETCRILASWIREGKKPVKISVNCSRVHFKNPKFLQPYLKTADKYNIEKSLIEIELTESIVFENAEQLTGIILEIRNAGFGCSMDDFGSGYSSLNLIQTIPVDTLKIDKVFFEKHIDQSERTVAVVGSMIRMAHSLNMCTVAEGVEYEDQVEMLKAEKCDYIQGYIFDKPMTVEAFEQRAFVEKLMEVGRREYMEAGKNN